MKLICDFSFVNNYVENFFSNNERCSASIVNSAITPHLRGTPLLVISYATISELIKLYPERRLVLDSFFDLCQKSEMSLDRIQSLIKMAAITEIEDRETYVLAEDSYIINEVNKTSHKAITLNEARELLKSKGMLAERE